MDRQANIKRFEDEMSKVNREGIDKLMRYIKGSDMYTAPASTRFHLSVAGGLLQHSLNVLDAMRNDLRANEDGTHSYMVAGKNVATITEESLVIMTLLHDICKTNFYKVVQKWRKDANNKWEQYDTFEVEDKVPYGHGEKSVMMIEEFMKLKPEERYAIRWHMGYTESDTLSLNNAIDKYPIIWALHSADTKASHFMESVTGNLAAYADRPGATYADQPTMADTESTVFEEATPI